MALPTENPHSRRKPGSTYPATEPLKSGSRLSPGMRIFWGNVPAEQNAPIRRSDSAQSDSGSSLRSSVPRFLEQDARTRTFYCACSFKTGERPIESLAGEAQLARYVLKLTSQVDGAAIGSGVEIKIEHYPLFGRANLHEFEALPKI